MACKSASLYVQTVQTWYSKIKYIQHGWLQETLSGRRQSWRTCGCTTNGLYFMFIQPFCNAGGIPWHDVNCYLPQGENEQWRCASCTLCCSALWVMQLSSSFETHPDTNMPITLSAFTNHALSQFCVVRHLPWQQMCVHGLRGRHYK